DHIESIANGPVYSPDQPITVRFALANLGPAELSVVDLLGRTVSLSVLESELAAGTYERTFAMPDGVPGVYFIVLRTATTQDAIPIQLLR
ncbi:MAG: T9SS type A sorting domain-containing protein, partial [Bradyrhizobiaceae bacterium]|nr:T9SS type A sorting domain-containing protein [Bradyrhizobiaceae bacterium]